MPSSKIIIAKGAGAPLAIAIKIIQCHNGAIKMYLCLNCNGLFEDPEITYETHGLEIPPYEKIFMCPYCGGDYCTTQKCIECGSYITDQFAKTSSGWICNECYTLEIPSEVMQ